MTQTSAVVAQRTAGAQAPAEQQQQQQRTTAKTDPKRETVKSLLASDYFKQQVAMALPKHMTADRFIRVALTAMMRTPKLLNCTKESLTKCLLDCSQMGLEPDGRRAHLIPFENRRLNVVECTLIVDYKGLVELCKRSGDVSNVHAQIVCENDTFEYDTGEVTHHIDFRKPRGAMYAVYTVIKFKDGGKHTEVMTKADVDRIRARSKAANSGPWVTDYDEMAKKTVFRRGSKWVVLSPEIHDVLERDGDPIKPARITAADLAGPLALAESVGANGHDDAEKEPEAIEAESEAMPEDGGDEEPDQQPGDKQPGPSPEPKGKPDPSLHTVQDTLAETVTGAGFNFTQFQDYLQKSKHLPDPSAFPEFAALPIDLCKRLNRMGAKLGDEIRRHLTPEALL